MLPAWVVETPASEKEVEKAIRAAAVRAGWRIVREEFGTIRVRPPQEVLLFPLFLGLPLDSTRAVDVAYGRIGANSTTVTLKYVGWGPETKGGGELEFFRAAIEEELDRYLAVPSTGVSRSSLADEFAQLADLHAKGILSDAEFAAAKQKLLG